jgi:hypothetical protein
MNNKIDLRETRRAKRTKKWLADGNVIPLSSSEKKKLENALYYKERKAKKIGELQFHLEYKNELFDHLYSLDFNLKGSLTYRNNISMFGAYKDAVYIFETMLKRGIIKTYFIGVEYADNHVHTHYLVDNYGFSRENFDKCVYKIFSSKKGYNYSAAITSKEDSLLYIVDKLNTNNKQRQSQIDYWFYNTAS